MSFCNHACLFTWLCDMTLKTSGMHPKMRSLKCFVCDNQTIIYCENVFVLRSIHTETPIIEYLKKFAEKSQTSSWKRHRNYEKTIICQFCMIKINEYDLACQIQIDMGNQLKELLKRKGELNGSDEDYNPEVVFSDSDEEREKDNVLAIEEGTQVTVMRCNVCEINFKSYHELTRHNHQPKKIKGLVIKKIDKNGHTKIIENFKDISTSKSNKSSKRCSKSVKAKVKVRKACCRQCGSLFFTKDELKEHVREVHHTDDGTRCRICRGLYPDKEVLKNHVILHEGKNRLQCVECNTVFTRSNGLMRHMSIHTGEKFHICDTCGKEFIYQSSFRRHLLVHGNVRNYCCLVCDKSFVQTTHLKVHMRSHSKEKPYHCPKCDKTFTYRYTMLAHYKSHPGVVMDDVLIKKSHSCSLCHLSFSQRKKLDDHYVSAHDAIIDGSGSRSNIKDSSGFENLSMFHLNV